MAKLEYRRGHRKHLSIKSCFPNQTDFASAVFCPGYLIVRFPKIGNEIMSNLFDAINQYQ